MSAHTPQDTAFADWRDNDFGAIIGAICVFNGLDAVATSAFVSMGLATEANPLMATLLDVHPALFAATKITLVSLCLILLARWRHLRMARISIALMFALYTGIIMLHIIGGLLSA